VKCRDQIVDSPSKTGAVDISSGASSAGFVSRFVVSCIGERPLVLFQYQVVLRIPDRDRMLVLAGDTTSGAVVTGGSVEIHKDHQQVLMVI
jgi:hypothetical protein